MTKREIDEMMMHLPSQKDWYEAEHRRLFINDLLAGLAFVACVGILCFM